ncbi:hypothetical protein FUAX_09630 [Fulvitalea axinellae]|uniref:Tyr recombinase domain-containing protein n=1 Tax=Fulvitalea axinellae TaxID=1182444 RepID=A0AAU9D6R0_9BACT|nr:hypothetical protein FUAX_09630 [Fulvitalea axinellae]
MGVSNSAYFAVNVVEDFLTASKGRVSEATYRNYFHFSKKIKEALTAMNQLAVEAENYQPKHLSQLEGWVTKNNSAAYAQKVVTTMKQAFTFVSNSGKVNNLIGNYRSYSKSESKKVTFLSEIEVEKIRAFEGKTEQINFARDFFLVQCYTGLAYIDLYQISRESLVCRDKTSILNIKRHKTKSSCIIPVSQLALDLLNQYDFKFSRFHCASINIYLKEITKKVGIAKNISTHVGRKTFATMLANRGVPANTVAKILGHASYSTTMKHYAEIQVDKVVGDVMGIL